MKKTLSNIRIALPESRQLDVLANLFEARGGIVNRCPLVSIIDSPRVDDINKWISDFIERRPDYMIILTGEGIRRLNGFAERLGCFTQWQSALKSCYKLSRGPKPNRVLKEMDMQSQELALEPTTDGVILSLDKIQFDHKTIAVQLYGEDPNTKLQTYLRTRNANYTTVAPYIYASDIETNRVVALIHSLEAGEIDLMAFTSKAQYQRLQKVAEQQQLTQELEKGLKQTKIAVVGPVVADQLKTAGFSVCAMPEDKYFMKPMVSAIENMFLDKDCLID